MPESRFLTVLRKFLHSAYFSQFTPKTRKSNFLKSINIAKGRAFCFEKDLYATKKYREQSGL